MPQDTVGEIIRSDLLEHPAVQAWRELRPERIAPESIEILKEHKKSVVYRLEGAGQDGSAVIAKRCRTETALIERVIYEEILPRLPITALHYYGFLTENDEFCWLFLEDAGTEQFSPLNEEQRALAGRWLGLMHISAARMAAAATLPDRGPGYYLEHLQTGRQTILQNLTNPGLTDDDLAVLHTILGQCDFLELRWGQLEKQCDGLPSTLVHGDFCPKNIYVRTGEAGTSLFPLDWEIAGWGIPAADLAPSCSHPPVHQVDLTTYELTIREHWPGIQGEAIQRLVKVGRIFRLLAAIDWESTGLPYEWLEKPMSSMRVYQTGLAEAIQSIYEGKIEAD